LDGVLHMIHSTAICKKGDTINELTDVGFL